MAGVQRGSALIGPALAGISVHALGYAATFLIFAGVYALSLLALVIAAKGEKGVGAAHRVPVGQVIRQHARVFATGGSVMILLQILRGARLVDHSGVGRDARARRGDHRLCVQRLLGDGPHHVLPGRA